jgi:hypothetical protein
VTTILTSSDVSSQQATVYVVKVGAATFRRDPTQGPSGRPWSIQLGKETGTLYMCDVQADTLLDEIADVLRQVKEDRK